MNRIVGAGAALMILGVAGPAAAGMPIAKEAKCPVGGKTFKYISTASYSIYGRRPDGKPFGSWEFPLAIPVCPDNGLVMYRQFDDAEVGRLKRVLRSDEYRALAEVGETPRYRAAWLERTLSPTSELVPFLLLEASWEADRDPARKARYQREFIQSGPTSAQAGDVAEIALQVRLANSERELGMFDAAMTRLNAIPLEGLDVPIPEERSVPFGQNGGHTVENFAEIQEARNRRGWLVQIKAFKALVESKNAESEPLQMIAPRAAAEICMEIKESDRAARDPTGVCQGEAVRKWTDMWAKQRTGP